jgi:hypothetical protein
MSNLAFTLRDSATMQNYAGVDSPIGNNALLAVAWCCFLTLVGYLWARAVYNRGPVK